MTFVSDGLRYGVFSQMIGQRSRKVINISSLTAYWSTPNFLHYVASNAVLIGMTRSLAREVGDYGICVNAIAPGLVEHEGQTAPKAKSARSSDCKRRRI